MVTQLRPQRETIYREGPATAALSDKVHDVIHLLSEKMDIVWRYDKYMEDCTGDEECRSVFQQCKEDELRHIGLLREQIQRFCRDGAFQ